MMSAALWAITVSLFHHCSTRMSEWEKSVMMIGMAVIIWIDPQTVKVGGFYLMTNIGLTTPVLGFLFSIGGVLRMLALFANGRWPWWGPRLRAAGAMVGASLWGQMCVALYGWSAQQGYISVGVAIYGTLVLGELVSVVRAATDDRTSRC